MPSTSQWMAPALASQRHHAQHLSAMAPAPASQSHHAQHLSVEGFPSPVRGDPLGQPSVAFLLSHEGQPRTWPGEQGSASRPLPWTLSQPQATGYSVSPSAFWGVTLLLTMQPPWGILSLHQTCPKSGVVSASSLDLGGCTQTLHDCQGPLLFFT